jgi:RNA polymerase sigma-70 factor (ECF subfamily)
MFNIEEVMRKYNEKLLLYATSVLCNHHDAEDVVQQVFLLAHAKRDMFDGENLNAWLYKITLNKCLDFKRKRKWFLFGDIREAREDSENPFAEEQENSLEILRHLKPADRALLYSRIMEERSYEELSQIFGKSPEALRQQYSRAKNKLAKKLRKDELKWTNKQSMEYFQK